MVVFRVLPQVFGNVVYPVGIKRDLDFRRTGVAVVQPVLFDNLPFFFFCSNHIPKWKPAFRRLAVIYIIYGGLSRVF